MPPDRSPGDERAVSDVLGYTLLVAMVFTGALALVMLGTGAIGDYREQISTQEVNTRLHVTSLSRISSTGSLASTTSNTTSAR